MRISDCSSDVRSSDLLAGPIARWTPDSWRWPERMAVRVLDESGPWAAGQRLMQAADPESWALIVAASPLTDANRETVQKCREQAEKAEKPVRCRSEEHTSELQSLMCSSYAVFYLK